MINKTDLEAVLYVAVDDYGVSDIRKLAYYIKTYATLINESDIYQLVRELIDGAESRDGNAVMLEVFANLMGALANTFECCVDDFSVYVDGVASFIEYLGDNEDVSDFVNDNL